jgi:hypothetical protein
MKKIFSSILFLLFLLNCSSSPKQEQNFKAITIPAGRGPGSVEVADFNADGLPDIVVANLPDSSITVLLNNGNKTFIAATGSPFYAGHFPNDITIADFNKDGKSDLAIANHERKYITLLVGNGKGQFKPAVRSPVFVNVKPHTHGIIAADFNGDGYLDIGTDSWGVDSIVIIYRDGKGGYSTPVFYAAGRHPYQRLRNADFNKDNKQDIVTTNLDGDNVTIFLGDGKGDFTKRSFKAGNTPFGVAIGDINADGNPDLAIVNAPTISGGKTGNDGLTVLLGDGTGNFSMLHGSPFTTGMGPTRVAIGDLNADGVNDIAVNNYNSGNISVYYMGRKGLLSSVTIKTGNHADGLAIHDMDGDGKNDIIVSNFDDNTINIFFSR